MIPLAPFLAICSLSLLATVVKVFHFDKLKLEDIRQRIIQLRTPSKEAPTPIIDVISTAQTAVPDQFNQAPSGSIVASVVINGQPVTFVKDSAQLYGHYDLAIDFCVKNGTLMNKLSEISPHNLFCLFCR